MAFPQGINFRVTLAFVTDAADEDHERGYNTAFIAYPRTTAQGNNVGWDTAGTSDRDRSSSVDRRLAGLNRSVGFDTFYRIDLPSAGNYDIRCALGDNSYAVAVNLELFDNTTSLGNLGTGSTSAPGMFKDATNTEYSAANWPGSNSALTKTFASTILKVKLNDVAAGAPCNIAHLHVASAGAPAGRTTKNTRSAPLGVNVGMGWRSGP